jgi:hypothetical protein
VVKRPPGGDVPNNQHALPAPAESQISQEAADQATDMPSLCTRNPVVRCQRDDARCTKQHLCGAVRSERFGVDDEFIC